jgi:uncharacterized protein involved in exopolysaccharide biosynthesis
MFSVGCIVDDQLLTSMFKRKWWLAAFLVAAVGFAVLLYWLLPPSYTVTNGFRIGQFMGVSLELPEFTKQRFKMVGFLADAYDRAGLDLEMARDQYPRAVSVSIENDFNKTHNVDTLIFSVRAADPRLAKAMSKALSDHLIDLHGQKLEQARQIREREIDDWRTGISTTETRIEALEQQLEVAAGSKMIGETAVYLLTSKIQEQRDILFHMKQLRHNVTLKNMNPVESFNTEIISAVRAPEKPSFPRLSLLVPVMVFAATVFWVVLCWLEMALSASRVKSANRERRAELASFEGFVGKFANSRE